MRYYIEKQGLHTKFYSADDFMLSEEHTSDKDYDITDNDIVDISNEECQKIEDKEFHRGKRCYFSGLSSYTYYINKEKRVSKEIRNSEIDTEIERYLNKVIKTPMSKYKKLGEKTSVGAYNYIRNDLYSVFTEYSQNNEKNTITISSIETLANSVRDHIGTVDLIRNIRRKGVYIYFKEDGIWTGNRESDIDLGVLIMLALCVELD